jgi:hypothetical protein
MQQHLEFTILKNLRVLRALRGSKKRIANEVKNDT